MKAKDLTQADVGKWVTLRAKIVEHYPYYNNRFTIAFEDGTLRHLLEHDATLEFTTSPQSVQEIGDVFKNIGGTPSAEWTISMIDGDACLLRYLTGHVSADYPLNPTLWEFVRKGTEA
jgi:hypothetical protein